MKKVLGIAAVLVLSIGMFSCQPENSPEEVDALYENIDANDDDNMENDGRN